MSNIISGVIDTQIFPVLNPYNGDVIEEVRQADAATIERTLDIAASGAEIGEKLPRWKRAEILMNAANRVAEKADEFALLISQESGKPITQARKEVARCVNTLELSGEEAKRLAGNVIPFDSYKAAEEMNGYYVHEPVGVVLAITPFNDPLNLVAHKLGPAIAGGNAVILKPSPLTPLCAMKLSECFLEAGLPPEMLSVVNGGANVGKAFVRSDLVRLISFTGSANAGHAIACAAGLKRNVMDLGGNAPVIIAKDADIRAAALSCVDGAYSMAGQNCIGVQRIIIHRSVYADFLEQFLTYVEALTVGNPLCEDTDMGPMISVQEAERIERWVTEACSAGASVVAGHHRDRAIYAPTVITDVPGDSKIRCREVFAPVVLLHLFETTEEAIIEANKAEYLLHAGVFSNDLSFVSHLIKQLKSSGVMINQSSDYRFDGMPFGGAEKGNMGREGVSFAVREMSQIKTICFNELRCK